MTAAELALLEELLEDVRDAHFSVRSWQRISKLNDDQREDLIRRASQVVAVAKKGRKIMKHIASLLLLLVAGPAVAQDVVPLKIKGGDSFIAKIDKIIVIPTDRIVFRSLPFELNATPGAADYRWTIPAGIVATENDDVLKITSATKSEFTVSVRVLVVDFDKKTTTRRVETLTFNVGDVSPSPPDPPKPDPPKPDPPKPPPIPTSGLSVLVVCEFTNGAPLLSKQQVNELWGEELAVYAATKFAKGPDGKTPEFRRFDKDIDVRSLSKFWQDGMAEAKGKTMPHLVISNGVTGYSGPLPDGNGKIIELIRRYER